MEYIMSIATRTAEIPLWLAVLCILVLVLSAWISGRKCAAIQVNLKIKDMFVSQTVPAALVVSALEYAVDLHAQMVANGIVGAIRKAQAKVTIADLEKEDTTGPGGSLQ